MSFAESITVEALEADPYPIYAQLRRGAPVAFVPAVNLWFVTRWKDVESVAKSPEIFSAVVGTSPVERSFGKPTILTTDGDVHRELRLGVDPKYRPRTVASYAGDLVRSIAEPYLDKIAAQGSAELMADYFEPVSTLSLARSLGLADVDMPTLRRWFYGLAQGAINFENDPKRQEIADAISAEVGAAVRPTLERLAREPDDSGLSHMLHDGMPERSTRPIDFLMPTIKVILLGGMQEPGHGAGSILVGLLTNTEQLRQVLDDPDTFVPKAVDEGLRWVAPIGTQTRQTTRPIELGGATIPAGAPVAALVSSASRDESRFSDPDRFDINRDEGNHAAFGFGHHFCSGRFFAREQMCMAVRLLLERFPDLRLVPGKEPVFRGWEFRAPATLHVALGAN
ncbi:MULTISPECIES: cytochrome P450 [unclassified Mesorhizobium]|uniref:cytochrome P450 n=1 Tax=unclassified Mesorhizobium TaxID=325217 RepID=UPI000F74D091|nr:MULTISPECIES: cytochrome P450 [unclassified Mesorhizobium]AZO71067.1 cytochrome P450 [Mesorhizobium sp. M1D.F.Ca.ET.043.01.1.1]RWA91268.1 MAG: cytochrome P450 [Mesorhizobium sp.]